MHDGAVGRHRASPQLHRRVLLPLGQCGQPLRVRSRRDRAALRQVRRLPVPASKRQTVALDEVEQLRDGIRPVARVQQGIGQSIGASCIPRSAKRRHQRVGLRQCLERVDEIAHLLLRRSDAKSPAVLLEQVDAGPAVRRVHHQVDRALGPQHGSKRTQTCVRIGKMVKHTGTHDQIEAALQLAGAFDRQLPGLEIGEVVLPLQLLGVIDTRRADVDADDAGAGRHTAYLAACHVPHPATRISRAARYGLSGQSR